MITYCQYIYLADISKTNKQQDLLISYDYFPDPNLIISPSKPINAQSINHQASQE